MRAATPPFADHYDHHHTSASLMALDAGERIGRPLPSRLARLPRRTMLLLAIGGAGWAWVEHPETADAWTARATGALQSLMQQKMLPTSAQEEADPVPAPLERIATREAPVVSPVVTEEAPAARSPSEVAATRDTDDAEAPPSTPLEPLPPPVVDPGDALQAKALAAGLHPGLSRVLLEALTDADFANARTAIRTALAKTPDGEAFTWPAPGPTERKAPLAQYEVVFVTGTLADCRRYVVRIAKSGWATTALPMEKCGIAKPAKVRDRARPLP